MDAMQQPEFPLGELIGSLDLTMPGDANSIFPVVDRVLRMVAEAGCSDGIEHDVELALREALANAVRHGAKNDPSKEIHCTVACHATRGLLIVIEDGGEGFDLASVPDCLAGENVLSHHGRGIYLITRLMDEVRFGQRGSRIHMIKRWRR
jgi:serine/threonine-protein kinase RsbW